MAIVSFQFSYQGDFDLGHHFRNGEVVERSDSQIHIKRTVYLSIHYLGMIFSLNENINPQLLTFFTAPHKQAGLKFCLKKSDKEISNVFQNMLLKLNNFLIT